MKKLFLFMCMALAALTSNARSYDLYDEPEPGDWAIGINLNNGTRNPLVNFGLGGKVQYYATSAFRIEANFNYFIERRSVKNWDTSLNLHYTFPIAEETFYVYPIIGATVMYGRYTKTRIRPGLNAGAGIQYRFAEHFHVFGEAIYKYASKKSIDESEDDKFYLGPRAEFSVGIAYRF